MVRWWFINRSSYHRASIGNKNPSSIPWPCTETPSTCRDTLAQAWGAASFCCWAAIITPPWCPTPRLQGSSQTAEPFSKKALEALGSVGFGWLRSGAQTTPFRRRQALKVASFGLRYAKQAPSAHSCKELTSLHLHLFFGSGFFPLFPVHWPNMAKWHSLHYLVPLARRRIGWERVRWRLVFPALPLALPEHIQRPTNPQFKKLCKHELAKPQNFSLARPH